MAVSRTWSCDQRARRRAPRAHRDSTAQYLRRIIDEVLVRLNLGQSAEEIFHAVASDPVLASRPHLRQLYDHPKFIVRNLIRQWGGWWKGNAADLLPATMEAQAVEIATLAGGMAALIARGRALLAAGNLQLASHVAEWAARMAPADRDALVLKRDVYAGRIGETANLMAQGIYRGALNHARMALGQARLQRDGGITL